MRDLTRLQLAETTQQIILKPYSIADYSALEGLPAEIFHAILDKVRSHLY